MVEMKKVIGPIGIELASKFRKLHKCKFIIA
jgi:hypothetical protein